MKKRRRKCEKIATKKEIKWGKKIKKRYNKIEKNAYSKSQLNSLLLQLMVNSKKYETISEEVKKEEDCKMMGNEIGRR